MRERSGLPACGLITKMYKGQFYELRLCRKHPRAVMPYNYGELSLQALFSQMFA